MYKLIEFVGHLYFLILPVIVGAVLNMVFIKLPVLKSWQTPMDGGKTLKDNKRIFGDNKTWKGFWGMIVLTAFAAWPIWHGVFSYSFFCGAWLGFAYALFELPNSFIKRRLDIKAGKNGGAIQTFFDQADSVIGFILLFPLIYPLTWQEALGIFVVATATHYLFNILLFYAGLRGQKG
ncbi:MAG: CDP-archaeol synthase [Peptococcaceae bacterium]|nr:CDP-archaeol synthase [Peptococcaceae bacterium]